MTSLLFITEVLSLQSEAVSFTKGFMWAGVIKALLDLHCLFRVIWREYNRCFSRRQSATTFRNWTWKSRSKWIQQVPCRIPLGWDCSWSRRRSSFLELWLRRFSIIESCHTLSTFPVAFSFPLRSGNTELLSHQKIQAFPEKISPSWLPCCSSQRCCRCNPKRSALLKDSCGLVS